MDASGASALWELSQNQVHIVNSRGHSMFWFSISSALRVDRKFNHPVAQRSQPSAAAGGRALPLCCQRRRHTVPAEPPNGLTRAAPDTCASATRGREGGRPQPPPRLGQLTAASRRAPAGASHPAVRWRRRGGSPLRAPRGACMMTRCLVVVYRTEWRRRTK